MTASRCKASKPPRPSSSTIVSNVHMSPRWLQNTPSTSNGVAPKRSATPATSVGATNRKTAADRRSGGSATGRRSGRPWAGRGSPRRCGPPGRAAAAWRHRSPAARHPSRPRSRLPVSRHRRLRCGGGGNAGAPLLAVNAGHDDLLAGKSCRPFGDALPRGVADDAGSNSSASGRTSMIAGQLGVPIRRKAFRRIMLLVGRHDASLSLPGRDTSACRLMG